MTIPNDSNEYNEPQREPEPENDRSIRSIVRKGKKIELRPRTNLEPPPHLERTGRGYRSRRRTSVGFFFIGLVVVIFLFFAVSSLFTGAHIAVTPRTATVNLDGTFMASQSVDASSTLAYDVMTLTEEATRPVTATGEETVARKASGMITIYNNFDGNSQMLVTNTRFETPDGKIFRIQEPVTVPGQKTVNGKTEPGSITVRVVADQPGAEYNIGPSNFTIPGFEGDPRFDAFYAKSEEPMTDGFEGVEKTVSDEDRDRVKTEVEAELQGKLLESVKAQLPQGYLAFQDGIFVTYEALPNQAGEGNTVLIGERARIQAIIFNGTALAREIARQTVPTYNDGDLVIENPDAVTFTLQNKDSIDIATRPAITFTLTGDAHLVWTFDPDALRDDLAGKTRSEAELLLSHEQAVETAEISTRPFWKRSMPDDVDDITVTTAESSE